MGEQNGGTKIRMAKKSRIRKFSKKLFLVLHLLISVLLLYPQFITPLSFIWINGFLGIATPYFVVLELLFLIFWLAAKPVMSIISVATLAISWKTIVVLFAWHPGTIFPLVKKENTLRIISWNVKGFNGNQKTSTLKLRTQDIAYSIQKWDPDIICMQEYNTNERTNDIANHANYFNKKYPYNFFSKDYQTAQKDYFSGCIIFSKYKIINAQRIGYLNEEGLIFVDILKGDDTARIYTTHLASYHFKDDDYKAIDEATQANNDAINAKRGVARKMRHAFMERAIQAGIVRNSIDHTPYPTILTGDFNDVPSSYTYRFIKGDWQDAFLQKGFGVGATYLGLSPTLRIDYILANDQWKIRAWESLDENLSDHHMIMADLQLVKN